MILDVEATRSIRQAEVGAVKTMIDRVQKVHDLMPERLIAPFCDCRAFTCRAVDTAYGSGPMLDWLVEQRGIAPHIPVIYKSGRKDGTFERADFTFDTDNDLYICPGSKELRQSRVNCAKRSRCHLHISNEYTGLGRLRLRGPCGAQDEFILAATSQNFKKLAKLAPNRNLIPKTV